MQADANPALPGFGGELTLRIRQGSQPVVPIQVGVPTTLVFLRVPAPDEATISVLVQATVGQAEATVLELKHAVTLNTGVLAQQQRLIMRGAELTDDSRTLASLHMEQHTTLHMHIRGIC